MKTPSFDGRVPSLSCLSFFKEEMQENRHFIFYLFRCPLFVCFIVDDDDLWEEMKTRCLFMCPAERKSLRRMFLRQSIPQLLFVFPSSLDVQIMQLEKDI